MPRRAPSIPLPRSQSHSRSHPQASAAGPALTVLHHPVAEHHLLELRDRRTDLEQFRRSLDQVATVLACESTRALATRRAMVTTPLARARGEKLRHPTLLVPILRAGLGLLPAFLRLLPQARVGFLGLKRHEQTWQPDVYHKSLPADVRSFEIILIDPMLATGGSAVAALRLLSARGARQVRLVSLVAAPEGVALVHRHFPNVPIVTAALDAKLNARAYIVPGLGDAGDRLFGT